MLRLVVGRLGQVHGQQLLVQVADLVQVGRRALAVALEHLVDLAVALRHVHVDAQPVGCRQALDVEQLVAVQHIGRLRAVHHRDAPLLGVVPFAGKRHRRLDLAVALAFVQRIQLAHAPVGHAAAWQGVDRRRQHGAHADLGKDVGPALVGGGIIAHGRGARSERLQHIEPRAGQRGGGVQVARVNGQPALHPVGDILRHAAHDRLRRVHVGVDQPGQQGVPAGVDHLACRVLRLQVRGGADGDNRVAAYGDGAVGQIADADSHPVTIWGRPS